MKSQGITKVTTIHSEGDMNVCNKFHDNPSSISQDTSLKTINIMVALEEKSGYHQNF